MDGRTECIKRVQSALEEVCNPQTLFVTKTDKDEEHQNINLKMKCTTDENEFTKLKVAFTQIETKARMIDFLVNKSPEEWPTLAHSDNKENFGQVKEDLKKAKQEAEHVEERLCDLIETTQEKFDELEEKKKEAQDAITRVEQKKAKLESLQTVHQKAMDGLEVNLTGTNMATKLLQQRETLKKTETAVQRCELALSELKGAVCRLREDCCLAQAVNKESEEVLTALRALKARHENGCTERHQWLGQSLAALREISGVSNIQVNGQTVTLDLLTSGSTSSVKAELRLDFDWPTDSRQGYSLLSSQLGQDVLDCKDVVAQAVATNDPVLLVTEVKRRLTSHAPVLQEVEQLRHHYAIDYVHEERVLQVMMGSSGQVVCTLSIQDGYPSRGGVKLTKIEGNGHHRAIEEYQPPGDCPTMSDWLKYLQSQL